VVIDDFDIKRIPIFEPKTYTPLIVDANAPLPFPVSSQRFQAVSWRDSQILQRLGVIQHLQLALGNCGKGLETPGAFAFKQRVCVSATKALDHRTIVYRATLYVKG
jgi:hypothetical protein